MQALVRSFVFLLFVLCVAPSIALAEEVENVCNEECLRQGIYSSICHSMCDAHMSQIPRKYSKMQFECFNDCKRRGTGAVWCMQQCRKWVRYKEVEDLHMANPYKKPATAPQ
jgi:hypothetical protein